MECCETCNQCRKSFENKIIDLLLRSKDYIGRGHIDIDDPDRLSKNKKLCMVIDRIRYGHHNNVLIQKILEKYKNRKIHINGGQANSKYYYFQKLDLGNASSTIEEQCGPNIATDCCKTRILYLGNDHSC